MADAIDMIEFVRHLSARKRGRACIVMTQDHSGQGEWSEKLAVKTGARHIDLLKFFSEEQKLRDNLSLYTPEKLFSLLRERVDNGTVIISGIEFLKASWSGRPNAIEEFAARIETWHEKPACVFVMQYDKALAERPFSRFRQYTFIVNQGETMAL